VIERPATLQRSPATPPSAAVRRAVLAAPRCASAATLAACLAALALGVALAPPSRAQGGPLLAPPSGAQSGPLQDLATFPRTTLEIRGKSGTHRFNVWVADTHDRQTQGLMYVRDLPPDEGMLFTHCCDGIWMKNTYIELDIVFVGANGRISKIAERAHPFDETDIPAPQPVKAVVELKGGEADQLGLAVGDRVEWASPEPGSGTAGGTN
jgi:uncharacterized protein